MIEKIANVSNKSVLKCTGKSWDQWVKILDSHGARAPGQNLKGQYTTTVTKTFPVTQAHWREMIDNLKV